MEHIFVQKKTFSYSERPILQVQFPLPQWIQASDCPLRVRRYYEKLSHTWLHRWETRLFPLACQAFEVAQSAGMAFPPWSAQLTHTCTWQDEHHLSLFSLAQEVIPSHLPSLVGSAVTWSLPDGFPCPYSDFLLLSQSNVRAQVQAEVETTKSQESSLLFSDCVKISKKTFSPHRFYLTQNAISFFYPMGILGPASEGLPTFSLPRSAI